MSWADVIWNRIEKRTALDRIGEQKKNTAVSEMIST